MRTTEFVCESSELTVLRRLYDRREATLVVVSKDVVDN
jgi:hypothetical protein